MPETIYENGGGGSVQVVTLPGLRWLDMQNYRDPPPYPGHSKQHHQHSIVPPPQPHKVFPNQPGYRQSYSGSETSTDVSLSSTENLSTSQRQDPQGEETRPGPTNSAASYQTVDHLTGGGAASVTAMLDGVGGIGGGGGYSILERLGMPASVLDVNKFSQQQQAQQQQQQLSSSLSSSSSYSAFMQERARRQGELAATSVSNMNSAASMLPPLGSTSGVSAYPASQQGGPGGESGYLSASLHHQSSHSASPLYSRGHLTVPQHHHWQSSRSGGVQQASSSSSSSPSLLASPSTYHYMTSSSSSSTSVARHHESSISSNSSSSSTLTMITRGGGGGGGVGSAGERGGGGGGTAGNANFSSSMLSYASTNRSSNNNNNNSNNNNNFSSNNASSNNNIVGDVTPRTDIFPSPRGGGIPSSNAAPPSSVSAPSCTPPSSLPAYNHQTYMSPRVPPVSTYHHPHPYVNQHWTVSGSGDSTSSGSLSSLVTASSSASSSRHDLPNAGGVLVMGGGGGGPSVGGAAVNYSDNSNPNQAGSTPSSTSWLPQSHPHPHQSSASSNSVKSASSASSSLSHLPSSFNNNNTNNTSSGLPPPPDYPGTNRAGDVTPRSYLTATNTDQQNLRPSKSYETMVGGHWSSSHGVGLRSGRGNVGNGSQNDLRPCASSPGIYVHDNKLAPSAASRGSDSNSCSNTTTNSSSNSSGIGADTSSGGRVAQMVEMLTDQNRTLREELAAASVKVAKLQKLEQEIAKVHDSHTALVQSSQKREGLWQAMKRKLEERIHNLEAKSVGGSAAAATAGGSSTVGAVAGPCTPSVTDTELRIKLAEKDAMISKLLAQNQDLSASRDQHEATNAQLSLSLAEQRAHVDILENALLNAQSRVLTLEEENRKKAASAEKVEQLQQALTSLQLVSEKQEKKEREMRTRLERELERYRLLEKGNPPKQGEPGKDDSKSAGMLRKMLDEKDARILQLETQIAGMEQRYVKEATLRQLNMESNTSEAPKEVRLAALEKSSSDMEKLIDEAKTEKLKHMEELHQSQRNVAELEAKVKQLQTQVVEKEAMLKVFQRSPLAMARSSSLHALCHHSTSPLSHSAAAAHSPRPSLISPPPSSSGPRSSTGGYGTRGAGESASTSSLVSTIRHMKTGSASAIELGRKMSVEEDLLAKVQSLRSESKSDSEEEVKLWHV